MKLLQRKQFPGPPPPPPQQAAGLVLLIVQVAPLPLPPPHEMMDQFSHFTRAQHRDNTLIMLLLVNTRTRPASHPRYRGLAILARRLSAEIVWLWSCRGTSPAPALWIL